MRDPRHAQTDRRRRLWFWPFAAGCLLSAAGYVAWRASDTTRAARPVSAEIVDPQSLAGIEAIQSAPHFYFSSARGAAFMRVGVTATASPASSVITNLKCERVHFGRERGICLSENSLQVHPRAFAHIVDRRFKTLYTVPLAGLPIRARVSGDDRYAAATVFVTGENYVSDFTTRTTVIDLAAGRAIADLEQFAAERDGRVFREVDFNFWGVTFLDDTNRFLATLGTGGRTLLVDGDIARRRMRVVRENVECPSLSPDQRRLVFKRRQPGARTWRLHALDLATMAEWPVTGEGLNVDDQAEWLDNEHVLYSIHDAIGLPEEALNIWISPVDPGTAPESRLFLRAASSPAVVR